MTELGYDWNGGSLRLTPFGQEVAKRCGLGQVTALLGSVPNWLEFGTGPAKEIFQRHYIGGWHPAALSWAMDEDGTLHYPGDPAMKPLVRIRRDSEEVFQYQHSWVAIRYPDGTFEVDRMD